MSPSTITLVIPAVAEHVRLARLVASGLGTQAGFGIDELDDVRIAVNEACSILMAHTRPGSDINLRFEVADGTVSLQATTRPADDGASFVPDELALLILKAAVDDHEIRTDRGELCIGLSKRSHPRS